MTIYYVDPENGNDANAGTSFGAAWQTISSGATLARITAGDTIRIKQTPDPTNVGTATWTNKSITVTLDSALTKNISLCESAWTADAAVLTNTTTPSKQGTNAATFAVNALHTGLAAHESFSTADFSGYTNISFWIRVSAVVAANKIRIALCSDTAGAVVVDDVIITKQLRANAWYPITLNSGAAMGSSIQSVALYIDATLGTTVNIFLDDIIATNSNSLSLNTVISQNSTGPWWAIRSINGTDVKLDIHSQSTTSSGGRGFSGTSGSNSVYIRESFPLFYSGSGPYNAINDTGTSGNPILYSGGWDSTNMSTQVGETWFDCMSGAANGMDTNGNTYNYISIERTSHIRASYGILTAGTEWNIGNDNGNISCVAMSSGGINFVGSGSAKQTISADVLFINQGDTSNPIRFDSTVSLLSLDATTIYTLSYQGNGGQLGTSNQYISGKGSDWTANNHNGDGIKFLCGVELNTVTANDNNGIGVHLAAPFGAILIRIVYANDNTSQGIMVNGPNDIKVTTEVLTDGNSAGLRVQNAIQGKLVLTRPLFNEGTGYSLSLQNYSNFSIYSHHDGWDPQVNTIRTDGGTIQSDTANNHAASGLSWKLTPTSAIRDTHYPLRLSLGKFPVLNANPSLLSGTVWVYISGSATVGARITVLDLMSGIYDLVAPEITSPPTSDFFFDFPISYLRLPFGGLSDSVLELFLEVYHISGSVGTTDCWVSDLNVSLI